MMVSQDHDGQSDTKRAKTHEARLIPGVDGYRIFGFPNSIVTKLRYCQVLTLTTAANATNVINVFSANGIFDPDQTGGGTHQPMWRDNYANIYDQYCVLGSKITVHFHNQGTTGPMIVGIVGDDDTTIQTDQPAIMEQNNNDWGLVGIATGQSLRTLTMTFSPMEAFGVDVKDDGASSTAVGANPTEGWSYGVWTSNAGHTTAQTVHLAVEILYTVKFTEVTTQNAN